VNEISVDRGWPLVARESVIAGDVVAGVRDWLNDSVLAQRQEPSDPDQAESHKSCRLRGNLWLGGGPFVEVVMTYFNEDRDESRNNNRERKNCVHQGDPQRVDHRCGRMREGGK